MGKLLIHCECASGAMFLETPDLGWDCASQTDCLSHLGSICSLSDGLVVFKMMHRCGIVGIIVYLMELLLVSLADIVVSVWNACRGFG